MAKKISYKSAGVDIKKADRLVRWIKEKTSASSFLGGDYACFSPLPLAGYKEPILAGAADGVGTKLKLAGYFNEWGGIGQDLAAMCLNDLICVGAKPLFFMDYYACGKLEPSQARAFLKGLEKACREAGCPLLGGETAELAGVYKAPDIDCAGFCVGLVEKSKILSPARVKPGDHIVALKSSGFHSNGYSLLRKIYNSPALLKQRKEDLLRPTRLYAFLAPFLDKIPGLRAIAHITGGGLDNLLRILPPGARAVLKPWKAPSCFLDARKRSGLPWSEWVRIFNCGLGLVLILKSPKSLSPFLPSEELIDLGRVEKTKGAKKLWSLDFRAMARLNS